MSTAKDGVPASGCGVEVDLEVGTERLTVPSADGDRVVERVIPTGYDGTTPQPVILSLHGFTSTIEQLDLFSDLPTVADERGYIPLTPQALSASVPMNGRNLDAAYWRVAPESVTGIVGAAADATFLSDLIAETSRDLCVDPNRVHVTGNSNGRAWRPCSRATLGSRLLPSHRSRGSTSLPTAPIKGRCR